MSEPVDKKIPATAPNDPATFRNKSLAGSFVVTCLSVGLVMMAVDWWQQNRKFQGQPAKMAPNSIDINAADWTSFSQLQGIGPTLGFRIVANRKHFGPFKSIDDLQRVEGIGPLTLDRIRYRLTIGHDQLKFSVQQRQPK